MRGFRIPFLLIALLAAAAVPCRATEEFAARTGQTCAVCHVDPAGGGPLTPTGEAFAAGGYVWPVPKASGEGVSRRSPRVFRFVLGFLHLTTAVIWFGTIFYVHLVLRPRYAAGGLPRSELRIAWGSILVLAVTGTFLTRLRFPNLESLITSRAGTLLLVKVGLFLLLVLSAAVATFVVSPRLRRQRARWQENDGRGGRPAWVRVAGRIYDLSTSPRWREGNHFRRHQAGQDLTEALAGAPHGAEKLEGFPVLPGEEGRSAAQTSVARGFYVMAYGNLLVALGILAVVALWRWG